MKGIVIKVEPNLYSVKVDNGVIECTARGLLKFKKANVLVGDMVQVDEDTKTIQKILPRKNEFIRPPIANVDQLVIVVASTNPTPDLMLLDKQLVMAEKNGVEILICLNKIDLNDDTVGGIPDDAAVQTSPSPNLSDKANLLTVDNLPVVTVTNLTSNNCSSNGSYVITATSSKELDYTSKEKITVPFSSPDSSGLCAITVTDKTKLTMNCENTQTFSANELIISSQVIYDSDDKTPLFKIED